LLDDFAFAEHSTSKHHSKERMLRNRNARIWKTANQNNLKERDMDIMLWNMEGLKAIAKFMPEDIITGDVVVLTEIFLVMDKAIL
jgi:hypothetical protein